MAATSSLVQIVNYLVLISRDKNGSTISGVTESLFLGGQRGGQTFIWGRLRGRHRNDLLCTIKSNGGAMGAHGVNGGGGGRAPRPPPPP